MKNTKSSKKLKTEQQKYPLKEKSHFVHIPMYIRSLSLAY